MQADSRVTWIGGGARGLAYKNFTAFSKEMTENVACLRIVLYHVEHSAAWELSSTMTYKYQSLLFLLGLNFRMSLPLKLYEIYLCTLHYLCCGQLIPKLLVFEVLIMHAFIYVLNNLQGHQTASFGKYLFGGG